VLTAIRTPRPEAAMPPSFSRRTAPPLLSRYERADYGSNAEAGALAGVEAGAAVPSVQVPVLGLYNS
jgi:hypothetical protein